MGVRAWLSIRRRAWSPYYKDAAERPGVWVAVIALRPDGAHAFDALACGRRRNNVRRAHVNRAPSADPVPSCGRNSAHSCDRHCCDLGPCDRRTIHRRAWVYVRPAAATTRRTRPSAACRGRCCRSASPWSIGRRTCAARPGGLVRPGARRTVQHTAHAVQHTAHAVQHIAHAVQHTACMARVPALNPAS